MLKSVCIFFLHHPLELSFVYSFLEYFDTSFGIYFNYYLPELSGQLQKTSDSWISVLLQVLFYFLFIISSYGYHGGKNVVWNLQKIGRHFVIKVSDLEKAKVLKVQSPLVIVDSSISGKLSTITKKSTITREIHAKIDNWSTHSIHYYKRIHY